MTTEEKHRPGTLFAVVGPSGAGKDSLISEARKALATDPDIGFVRRFITRPDDGVTEDHIAVSESEFREMAANGAFAVHWQAHGLLYGVPAETIEQLAQGTSLIVNGSREHLSEFARTYDRLVVLHITASPETIAARLVARARESSDEIMLRMARQTQDWQIGLHVVTIDNSSELQRAANELLATIAALRNAETD